jgi:DNA recombination protein RmuC
MTIALIILGVLNALLLFLLLRKSNAPQDNTQNALLLKQDLTTLTDSVTKLKDGIQSQLNERLDKSNQQMLNQFKESAGIIKDVTQKLTALEKTNQQVGDIAGELKVLQNVLANPKQRGVLGEYYLSQVLENVLPPDRFALQHRFKDGEIVDAVIKLDGKLLSVDSKFSLENYNRLIEAKDKIQRDLIARQFKADLKNRIDETAKYIRPKEDTMDYAFMFIPSEAIYYDLLINKVGASGTSARDLLEYAFREKNVIIVSPTTFMAYLQTVLQGLRALQIEGQAKEIQVRVGELGRHLTVHEKLMQKLGGSLGTTVNHFNNAHKELKKVDKDIVKIADSTAGVEPLLLEKPNDEDGHDG